MSRLETLNPPHSSILLLMLGIIMGYNANFEDTIAENKLNWHSKSIKVTPSRKLLRLLCICVYHLPQDHLQPSLPRSSET